MSYFVALLAMRLLLVLFMISSVAQAQIADSTVKAVDSCSSKPCKVKVLIEHGWTFINTNPEKAYEYSKVALKDSSHINRPLLLDSLFRFTAFCYGNLNNRPQTLLYHIKRQKALANSTSNGELRALASAYFETAGVLLSQDDSRLAAPYYLRCVETCRKIEYKSQMGQALMSLGEIYRGQNKLDSALLMFKQGGDVFRQYPNYLFLLGYAQIHIAKIYQQTDEREKALLYADSALGYALPDAYPDYNGLIYQKAGQIFLNYDQDDKALIHLRQAQVIMEKNNKFFYLPGTYRLLSRAYRKINADSSITYLEKYVALNDSVLTEKNNKKIAELQIAHQEEENKTEIQLLKKRESIVKREKELADKENAQKEQIILMGMIAIFIFILLVIFLIRMLITRRIQNRLISRQKQEVEEKSKEIYDSITYAKRIQNAIMPDRKKREELFPESFVLYKPKDQLSGDFYWCGEATNTKNSHLKLLAVGDCTGHGVPGALLSILGVNYLKLGETHELVNSPAQALDYLNKGVFELFNSTDEHIRDGMDISLYAIEYQTMKMYYACAKNPIFVVRNSELIVLKGDRHPIGKSDYNHPMPFSDNSFDLQSGDMIYLCSDGYQDQFGGVRNKKFKISHLKKLLIQIAGSSAGKQHEELDEKIKAWMQNTEQTDDICIVGVRV
jgi:serine phosphatase RsbU (regulator of sigma subunit)